MKTLIIIGLILGVGIILFTVLNTLSEIRNQECKADGGIMTGPFSCMISHADYTIPPINKTTPKPIPDFDLLVPSDSEQITSENIDERLEITKQFIDSNTFEEATILQTEIDYVSKRVVVSISSEDFSEDFTDEYFEEKIKNWIPFETRILIVRGFVQSDSESLESSRISDLEVIVSGEKQVRRGTTHSIEIQVIRGTSPIEGARVFLDIEDYGENIIKEFKGYTDSRGYFVFSWEIPQSFDDVETLLAIIDVTDGRSSKTVLFKFQVYCLPGEQNCKAKGN